MINVPMRTEFAVKCFTATITPFYLPLCICQRGMLICSIDGHAGDYAADFVKSVLGSVVVSKLISLCDGDSDSEHYFTLKNKRAISQAISDSFLEVDRYLCSSLQRVLPKSFLHQNTLIQGKYVRAKRHDFEKHLQTRNTNSLKDPVATRISSSGCVLCMVCVVDNLLITAGLGDCGVLLKQGREWWDVLSKHHPKEGGEKTRIIVRRM